MSNMTIPGLSFDASNESPFDSIRQVDATGEFWMGRQLMPLLEYGKWERFEDAIERAMTSCNVTGMSVADHFFHFPASGSENGRGVTGADYKMSRYGCYLTAMNGDPRKPAIAAAQAYFVAKTRQAETTTAPQPIAPPTDPFWQLIDGAIARNMQPEQVISLKRLYDGTPAPTPAVPKAAKVKPEPQPKPLPPLTAEIAAVVSSNKPVTICDVLARIGYNPNSKVNQMQAADSLKILGWKSVRRTFNGKVGRVWEHK